VASVQTKKTTVTLAEAAPLRPPQYKASSNLYTILLVLSFLAYTAALVVTIREMEPYCSKDGFVWGMFK